MVKYRLQYYRLLGQRLKLILVLIAAGTLFLIIYGIYKPDLGQPVVLLFVVLTADLVLIIYHTLLVGRASIQVRPQSMRLQGPLYGTNISYGRVRSLRSTGLGVHYPFKSLGSRDRQLVKPLFGQTCLFIELDDYPRGLKSRKLWFPRIFFGQTSHGLLVHTDDWLALTSAIDEARAEHRQSMDKRTGQAKTLVGRILAEDLKFS